MAAALLVFYQGFTHKNSTKAKLWQLLTNTGPRSPGRPVSAFGIFHSLLGDYLPKISHVSGGKARISGIPPSFSAEQEAVGDSSFLPHPEGESAAGGFPIRLSREIEAQASMTEGQAKPRITKSGSGTPRAANGLFRRDWPPGTMAGVAGHHRHGDPVCRIVRHGMGHHRRVSMDWRRAMPPHCTAWRRALRKP